jgi:hypothetical protein
LTIISKFSIITNNGYDIGDIQIVGGDEKVISSHQRNNGRNNHPSGAPISGTRVEAIAR